MRGRSTQRGGLSLRRAGRAPLETAGAPSRRPLTTPPPWQGQARACSRPSPAPASPRPASEGVEVTHQLAKWGDRANRLGAKAQQRHGLPGGTRHRRQTQCARPKMHERGTEGQQLRTPAAFPQPRQPSTSTVRRMPSWRPSPWAAHLSQTSCSSCGGTGRSAFNTV